MFYDHLSHILGPILFRRLLSSNPGSYHKLNNLLFFRLLSLNSMPSLYSPASFPHDFSPDELSQMRRNRRNLRCWTITAVGFLIGIPLGLVISVPFLLHHIEYPEGSRPSKALRDEFGGHMESWLSTSILSKPPSEVIVNQSILQVVSRTPQAQVALTTTSRSDSGIRNAISDAAQTAPYSNPQSLCEACGHPVSRQKSVITTAAEYIRRPAVFPPCSA